MKLIPLAVGSKEFDEIAKHITKSYPNACIMFIDKVENPPFEKEYIEMRVSMKAVPNETLLFHGTSEANAYSILENGFDPLVSARASYGKGTYFASSALISSQYMGVSKTSKFDLSHMLIASVLVGEIKQGIPMRLCPEGYDTQVDSVFKPTIYSVPRKEQAIPRYFIGFHKGAT